MPSKDSIELGNVTPSNVRLLKLINQIVFPVLYNDKFYKEILEAGELTKLAYYNDIVVGGVCCRIDLIDNQRNLYIMTLGCLPSYRRLGIGSMMLDHVLNIAKKDGNIDSISLHVQINNQEAISFYQKFGFEIVDTLEDYYRLIEPSDAYVLSKKLKNS